MGGAGRCGMDRDRSRLLGTTFLAASHSLAGLTHTADAKNAIS